MSEPIELPDQAVAYCPLCGQVTGQVYMPDIEGFQIHCLKCDKWTVITHIFESERGP